MEGTEVADDVGLRADIVSGRANLPVSNPGTEAEVVGKERWEELRWLQRAGQSVSAIARLLDVDRKTVRHGLRHPAWAPYRREAKGETVLSPPLAWLAERAPQVHALQPQIHALGHALTLPARPRAGRGSR